MQVEDELAKEKDNSAKLENSVTDLTSQCRISLQQMEEFRKEVKEKVSEWYRRFSKEGPLYSRRFFTQKTHLRLMRNTYGRLECLENTIHRRLFSHFFRQLSRIKIKSE